MASARSAYLNVGVPRRQTPLRFNSDVAGLRDQCIFPSFRSRNCREPKALARGGVPLCVYPWLAPRAHISCGLFAPPIRSRTKPTENRQPQSRFDFLGTHERQRLPFDLARSERAGEERQ